MITAKIIHWIKGIWLYNPMNDRYVNDAPDIERQNIRGSFCKQGLYSHFEKRCRKKYTRQSRKILWVVLRSLFFIEILKEWQERPWTMFPSAKAKQQK